MTPDAAACEALVREGDPDRWLATLLAPEAARPHLLALYAFSLDVARIRERVSAPMPGEVRLQWWRDALAGSARGDAAAHPVAAALEATIRRFALPRAALEALIDARTFDLYDDPMPSMHDLEGYCGETASSLFRLASLILADGGDPGPADAAGHAGVAFAVTGILRALPWTAARGQCYVPVDVLAEAGASRDDLVVGRATSAVRAALAAMRTSAHRHLGLAREAIRAVPQAVTPAFLPLALIEPYLGRMGRRDYDPFATIVERPQWRRQWTLWQAARVKGG